MKKIVLASHAILTGKRGIDNIVYSKSGEELHITFSHSQVTDYQDFELSTWEKVLSLVPAIKDIKFDRDTDTMIYDLSSNSWSSTDE